MPIQELKRARRLFRARQAAADVMRAMIPLRAAVDDDASARESRRESI